jgi:pimeloyl-ACP methyl ester carboxylesterase
MSKTEQHLTLSDGKQMCWAEYGDPAGTPVFLFHGNPGSRLAWGAMPHSPFVPGARIVAPDRPGYGRTDFKRRALERWPADVAELADHLGIDRFAVFGPSGGAPYALACAWQIPGRLTSVGVFGAVGPCAPAAVEGVQGSLKVLWRIAKPLQWVVRLQMWIMSLMARRDPARLARRLGGLELSDDEQAILDRPEILRLFSVDFREAYRQGGIGSAYDTTVPANWPIPLEEVRGRVLLWHAERDPLVGNMTLYLAEHLEDVDLRVLRGEGHLWILDHVPEVLEALLAPDARFKGAVSEQGLAPTSVRRKGEHDG